MHYLSFRNEDLNTCFFPFYMYIYTYMYAYMYMYMCLNCVHVKGEDISRCIITKDKSVVIQVLPAVSARPQRPVCSLPDWGDGETDTWSGPPDNQLACCLPAPTVGGGG